MIGEFLKCIRNEGAYLNTFASSYSQTVITRSIFQKVIVISNGNNNGSLPLYFYRYSLFDNLKQLRETLPTVLYKSPVARGGCYCQLTWETANSESLKNTKACSVLPNNSDFISSATI